MKSYSVILLAVLFLISCQHSNKQTGGGGIPAPPKNLAANCNPDCLVLIDMCNDTGLKLAVSPAPVKNHQHEIADFYKKMAEPEQVFTFSPFRDTIIEAQEGTRISISLGSFVYEETGESVTGDVKLTVREYYDLPEIITSNLTTVTTDSRLLETAGMIYMDATANGKKCRIKDGESIEISFKPADMKEGMQLFTGVQNSKKQMEWEEVSHFVSDFYYLKGYGATLTNDMPIYPGGFRKFIRYLAEEVKYPKRSFLNGVRGKVTVSFTIDRKGNLHDVRLLERGAESLNKSLVAAIDSMPIWLPGRTGVIVTMPITFGRKNTYNFSIHKIMMQETYVYEETASIKDLTSLTRNEGMYDGRRVSDLSRYVFSTTQLGWINCDRFYEVEREKTNFFVNAGRADDADVKMVFHSMRAVVSGYEETKGSFAFSNVPAGEKVTIVGFKYDGGKMYLAKADAETGSTEAIDLTFVEMTEDALKSELAELNVIN